MGSPDTQGPRMPKRHPACPGGRRCQISGCIHNARFSTDGISFALLGGNDMLGAYPSIRLFTGGWLYQHLDAANERMNIRGLHDDDEANATIGDTVNVAQTKIKEVSAIMFRRITSWLNSEMPA